MSRSFKRTPIYKDNFNKTTKVRKCKREANKRVRRIGSIPNGNAYKKYYESWDIHDYISYCPKEWYPKNINIKYWYKAYYRK